MSENNNEEIFEAEVCEICEIEKPKKIFNGCNTGRPF